MNTNTHVTLDQIKALLFKAATLDEALDALDANGISYRGEICYVIDSHGVMFWKARRYAFPLVISIDSENQCDTLAQYSAALQSAQALSPEVPATDSPESIAPFSPETEQSTVSVDNSRRFDYVKTYVKSGLLRDMLRNERRLKRSMAEGYQL